ncbi:hypothetical protein GLAREA_01937 [Glarea lozoyensis ATCC 20868]|uniref:Uncharacterized protein n=1 Tax=Glarea lozoyensis (strain ATCC 20868 / MF5171) TaxID=1116229 RepID=S3CJP7_GLAL2|nr:uncharacterized protein GLAREA_01937 [Glarea lozoyensis ATCC 20868]EPE26025.1 hypothetical protein GLAREA_01937 [Glarea lozoyensis ATCC 20868]
MQSLSVVLLATLLPTLLTILILSCLSIYLFAQLRASTLKASTAEILPAVEEPEPEQLRIVEIFNPDKRHFLGYTLFFKPWEGAPFNIDNREWFSQPMTFWEMATDRESSISDWDDTEVGEALKALGYEVMPAASVLSLLRNPKRRKWILEHVIYDVVFRRTSLEGDPHESYLPFTVQQHEDLRAYFDSLKNVKFSPDVATELAKLPFTLARAENLPHANIKKLIHSMSILCRPYSDSRFWDLGTDGESYLRHGNMVRDLVEWLYVRIVFMMQFQKYEFRLPESTEETFCVRAEVWTYIDEDGTVLEEKRICRRAIYIDRD